MFLMLRLRAVTHVSSFRYLSYAVYFVTQTSNLCQQREIFHPAFKLHQVGQPVSFAFTADR